MYVNILIKNVHALLPFSIDRHEPRALLIIFFIYVYLKKYSNFMTLAD